MTVYSALLIIGYANAARGNCLDLFAPNDFLSAGCQIAGRTPASTEFARICSSSCIQGLQSYTLALKSACGTDGVAEAARVEAECSKVVSPRILKLSSDCLDYFSPNDFLNAACQISGRRVSGADLSKLCSASCSQGLSSYSLALRSSCGTVGVAEAKRIEDGCESSKTISYAIHDASSRCIDGFGPNDFLNIKCQIQDGSIDSPAEFQRVCSDECRFDLKSYLYALKAACANEGAAEALRIENGCKSTSYAANAVFGKSCISFYNASDFLKPDCQIGDARVVSSSDFAKVCSPNCQQDLRGYLSALRATCSTEGDLEASRVEKGCKF